MIDNNHLVWSGIFIISFIVSGNYLLEAVSLLKKKNIKEAEGSFLRKYPRIRNVIFFGLMFILTGIAGVLEILRYSK